MKPLNEYRKTRILTATPGELIVMLYDGLLGRVENARKHVANNNPADAGVLLNRAHDILHELIGCLDHEKAPQLADSLTALYSYCANLLVEGLGNSDLAKFEEVYTLLKPLRDAWADAERQIKTNTADMVVNE
jgi:flagellar protein FliS